MGTLVVFLFALTAAVLFACTKGGGLRYASVTEDFKKEYYVGDAFEVAGSLKMFTDADTFTAIPVTADMISEFDTSVPGDVIIKVTYGDFVASVPIKVLPLNAASLVIDQGTLPTVVYQNRPFPSGVTMSAVLANGTTTGPISVTAEMLGGFDSTKIGTQSVTVGYLGATVTFSLLIKEDVMQSVSLVGAKDTYSVGEALSISGAYLAVSYESGKISSATLTENLISGFSTESGGSFTAKIDYQGLRCDYPYFVQKQATSFLLDRDSLPTVFEKRDVFPSGGSGLLTYDDGTTEVVALTAAHGAAFDTAAAGDKTVPIVVSGVSDDYSYTVLPDIQSAIPFGFTPAVMKGAPFDQLGKLIVYYEADQKEDIPFRNDDRLSIVYSTQEEGDVLQKVTFRGREYPFTVHVYAEEERNAVDHLEVAGVFRPIKWGDPLDVTGVQIGIVYKYLSSAIADCEPAWASVQLPDELEGDYQDVPVKISCLGAEVQSTVRVLSAEYAARVTSLSASGFKKLYVVGDALSLEGASLTATLGGGYETQAGIVPAEAWITGFDTVAAGEKTMTVTYGACELEVPYRVIEESDKVLVTDVNVTGFAPLLFVGDDISDIDVSKYTLDLTLGYGFGASTAPLEATMLSGGPFDVEGRKEVLLSYDAVQKTLYVTVHPVEDKQRVTAVSVSGSVTANVGTQPDFSGVSLTLTYGYGYATDSIPLTSAGVTIGSFQNDREGTVRTTVEYAGQSCGLFINFVSGDGGNVLQKVEIEAGSKTEFTIGEELGGVRLVLYYKSGTDVVDVTADMAPDFSTQEAGAHSITVSYGGKGATYSYTVTEASGQGQQ